MIEIILYSFNKRINSTKIPNSTGVNFICSLNTPYSYQNPIAEIKIDTNGQTPSWNYAYIPNLHRYYFIDNIVYNLGVWNLSLRVDVLASFKNDIINTTQYVLRSSNVYDDNLIDNMYISKSLSSNKRWDYEKYKGINGYPNGVRFMNTSDGSTGYVSNYFDIGYEDGMFVIGIIGNNSTGVSYYAMSFPCFKNFVNKAFTFIPSDMTDVSTGIANAIYNPIQYITTCYWYPNISSVGNSTRNIKLGAYTLSLDIDAYILNIQNLPKYYISINIPKHPDVEPYKNLSPYTEMNLFFQPFGNIPIDTTKIYGEELLYISWTLDFVSGMANIIISTDFPSDYTIPQFIIYETNAEYGIPIPLSSMHVDWKLGLGLSALSWVKSFNNNEQGNFLQNIRTKAKMNTQQANFLQERGIDTSPLSNIENANQVIDNISGILTSSMGQLATKGASGSFLGYNMGLPYLYAFFYTQTEKDSQRFGKPLHRKIELSNINGFCLCANASLTSTSSIYKPLLSEQIQIENFLNSGIYIE